MQCLLIKPRAGKAALLRAMKINHRLRFPDSFSGKVDVSLKID